MTLPTSFLTHALAHRALHDDQVAENSIGAIKAAMDHGYGIEIDIQPSQDGIPMVFHDYDLGRLTTQSGPIAQRTAAQLTKIDLIGGGGPIPTLEDVLKTTAGRVPLLIEIKDQDGALGSNVGALEKAVCKVLQGYQGDVALMSFNPHSVAACARFAFDIPRGLTTCPFPKKDWPAASKSIRENLTTIPDFDRVGASFISHQQDDLKSPHVARLKALGVPVLCWTIRNAKAEAEARQVADNVTFESYHA